MKSTDMADLAHTAVQFFLQFLQLRRWLMVLLLSPIKYFIYKINSRRIDVSHMNKYILKCWKLVKIFELKQKDEICLGGKVAKAEKIKYMVQG